MKTSNEIRTAIAELTQQVDNIVRAATAENRELNTDERVLVDSIHGVNGRDGQLATLSADYERAVRLETAKMANMQNVIRSTGGLSFDVGPFGGGNEMRSHNGQRAVVVAMGDKMPGVEQVPKFAFGEMMRAKAVGIGRHTSDFIRAALSESDNSLGGFAVPNPLSSTLIDLARAQSVVLRAGANILTMDSESLQFARITADPVMQAKGENVAFNEATITFGGATLQAHTIGCVVTCSRELVEDAPNFAQIAEMTMSKALAAELDRLAIAGTGAGQPTGLTVNSSISSTGSIGAIAWADIALAITKVRIANHQPNAVVMHPDIHGDVVLTSTGDGVNSPLGWLPAPPTNEGVGVFQTTNIGTGFIVAGDFTKLFWGLRQRPLLEATTSGGDAFQKHQVKFKITWRGDTLVSDSSAFYRLEGITT